MAYSNIKDPSAYFQAKLYTGNNTANHAITNDGNSNLQPDLVLMKHRTGNHSYYLVDSSRGRDKGLATDSTNAETTSSSSTKDFQSFDTNGFTVGEVETTDSINAGGGSTIVAWQWKANGGTTVSNTDGSITSTVQANTDAGFSIFTYTGTGAAGTVGHGLGGLPDLIIYKGRNTTSNWPVYIDPQKDGTLQFPKLNGDDANIGNSPFTWDTTKFTFTSASSYSNTSGTNYIAYAFRSIQGYSKIGSYVGNASTDGTFVYTGFKPACIITKTTGAAEGWGIYDNKRAGFNVHNDVLSLNSNGATYGGSTYTFMDILSSGFKCRRATYGPNQATSYIYMAFAENPFVAGGIPTTAR